LDHLLRPAINRRCGILVAVVGSKKQKLLALLVAVKVSGLGCS